MSPAVLTAGETMIRLMGGDATRLRHAASLAVGIAGAESNLAIGLRRLGHDVSWVSRLGDDELGTLVLQRVAAEGVDTSCVQRVPGASTGLLLREQAPEGQRVYYYRRGSAATGLRPGDVDRAHLEAAQAVHLTGITPALSREAATFTEWLVDEALEAGATLSLDVNFRSRLWSADDCRRWIEGVLPRTDLLFVSREEGEALWGEAGEPLLRRLADTGAGEVVLKGDEEDTLALVTGRVERAPLFPVACVDPVGAGDAFAAGYLDARLRGLAPVERLLQANAMGAISVMGQGDYEGLPDRKSLEGFLAGRRELGR